MKTSAIYVVYLQRICVAMSNDVKEHDVISLPTAFFLQRHCKQILVYSCKLESTVFSLPKRCLSSKECNLRRHFETQHPHLAELDANEKRLKA